MVFVPGVEYGFLYVYNIMWELFKGMYLNIVVIVTCFVASFSMSLLINVYLLILYIATVKGVVLIIVNAPYKCPSLFIIIINNEMRTRNHKKYVF